MRVKILNYLKLFLSRLYYIKLNIVFIVNLLQKENPAARVAEKLSTASKGVWKNQKVFFVFLS